MTETPSFNLAEAEAQAKESLLKVLASNIRVGRALISARVHGDLQRMTKGLEISDLHAQVLMEAGAKFERIHGNVVAPYDALLQIYSDEPLKDRLLTHMAQHMEVSHAA